MIRSTLKGTRRRYMTEQLDVVQNLLSTPADGQPLLDRKEGFSSFAEHLNITRPW